MGCDEAGVYGDVGLRFRPFLSSLVREVMILAKYLGASNDLIMICNFEFFFRVLLVLYLVDVEEWGL